MGETDNLSFLGTAQVLKKNKTEYTEDTLAPVQIEEMSQALTELAKSKNRIKPKIKTSYQGEINFMPQRYLTDNKVFQELVDVTPDSKRVYPKGLDVFAAFGVSSTETLLTDVYKEPGNWSQYTVKL